MALMTGIDCKKNLHIGTKTIFTLRSDVLLDQKVNYWVHWIISYGTVCASYIIPYKTHWLTKFAEPISYGTLLHAYLTELDHVDE